MYTRRQAVAGGRVYVCRNRRQSTGLCDASPVPAVHIETHVLRHLDLFIGGVEDWIAEQLDEHDVERDRLEAACDRARREHDEAAAIVQKAERRYLAALDTDDEGMVGDALRTARGDLEQADQRLQTVEARLSELSGPPNMDEALDYCACRQKSRRA
jgi:hypothetical protein